LIPSTVPGPEQVKTGKKSPIKITTGSPPKISGEDFEDFSDLLDYQSR
jgi:hypothetical protein